MKLEFQSRDAEWDENQRATRTLVWLGNSEGAKVPVYLGIEALQLSISECYRVAMDKIYDDNFPNKAEKESISAIKEDIEKIKEDSIAELRNETSRIQDMLKMVTEICNQIINKDETIEVSEDEDSNEN